MNLIKARLMPKDAAVPMIEFMFNPTELTFEKVVETSENKGARTEDKGQAKVAFANINPYKVTINKIIFDTYETGENVTRYIEPFRQAVQFPDQKSSDGKAQQRTPLYTFTWGGQVHLRSCFVEKLTYKLTLFLPDGTPVRAVIDSLSLKEADEPKPNNSGSPIQPSRLRLKYGGHSKLETAVSQFIPTDQWWVNLRRRVLVQTNGRLTLHRNVKGIMPQQSHVLDHSLLAHLGGPNQWYSLALSNLLYQ